MIEEHAAEYHDGMKFHYSMNGFISYIIEDNECTLIDVFIIKGVRRTGKAKRYIAWFEMFLKRQGIEYVWTEVQKNYEYRETSIALAISCGMEQTGSDARAYYLYKEI